MRAPTRAPSANSRDSSQAYEHAAFQGRRPPVVRGVYPRIPVLAPRQLLLVPALRDELLTLARASNKLAVFSANLVLDPAHIMGRYGILTVESFKQTDRQARAAIYLKIFAIGNRRPSRNSASWWI